MSFSPSTYRRFGRRARAAFAASIGGGGGFAAITDSFDRADNAASLGSTDTGQVWTPLGGNICGISSNRAYIPGVASTAGAVIDRGSPNMTVAAVMVAWASSGGNTGLIWRCIDANNYWWTQRVGGQLLVHKVVAGADTVVQTYTTPTADGDTHSVSVNGAHLVTVKVGVTVVGTFTDAANSTGTKAGFGGNPLATDRWENFSCTSP